MTNAEKLAQVSPIAEAAHRAAREAMAAGVTGRGAPMDCPTAWYPLSDGRWGRFVMHNGGLTTIILVVDREEEIAAVEAADWVYERLSPYLANFPADSGKEYREV